MPAPLAVPAPLPQPVAEDDKKTDAATDAATEDATTGLEDLTPAELESVYVVQADAEQDALVTGSVDEPVSGIVISYMLQDDIRQSKMLDNKNLKEVDALTKTIDDQVPEEHIENITLEEHRRDGVHVNGPASDGVIRGVRGDSHDDDVALNAWEWKNYAPSFGPIERIIVEDVTGWPDDDHEGNISIRLLPGVKRFDDGTRLDCPIRDITLRRLTDIRHFKIYDQPNLELGRDKDFSIGVGTLKNLRIEDLTFNRPGQIELHANTDGLSIHNVSVNHPITPEWHLLAIGPLSRTAKRGNDPAKWTEIFSPDLDCTVSNVSISGVRTRDSQTELPIDQVVKVIEQKLNPDYPTTTPKGGTGKGIWIR
jgi:hypothetical protein